MTPRKVWKPHPHRLIADLAGESFPSVGRASRSRRNHWDDKPHPWITVQSGEAEFLVGFNRMAGLIVRWTNSGMPGCSL